LISTPDTTRAGGGVGSTPVHTPKITKERQSFALCAMIDAQSEREYVTIRLMTTAKMKIDAARPTFR
jgi:hypothetical protein